MSLIFLFSLSVFPFFFLYFILLSFICLYLICDCILNLITNLSTLSPLYLKFISPINSYLCTALFSSAHTTSSLRQLSTCLTLPLLHLTDLSTCLTLPLLHLTDLSTCLTLPLLHLTHLSTCLTLPLLHLTDLSTRLTLPLLHLTHLLTQSTTGVTPIQSVYLHLAHKYKANPSFLKKCVLVWSVRDEILISNFPNLSVVVPTTSSGINSVPVAPSIDDASDVPLDTVCAVTAASQPVDIENNQNVRHKKTNNSTAERDGDREKANILGDTPFQKLIYVSSNTGTVSNNNSTTHRDSQTTLRGGRPDLSLIFSQTALLCVQESHARVAVVACGPCSLMDDVERLCTYRHEGVAFDLHKETFNL